MRNLNPYTFSFRPFINTIAALSIFYGLTSTAMAETRPQIAVTGFAENKVSPDELHWSVQVSNIGKTPDQVAKTHTTQVSEVLSLLKSSGVKDKDMQTSRMQLTENWVYRNNSRFREGFIANTTVQFLYLDFEQYTRLWSKLAGIDGVSISNVSYDYSRRKELESKTRLEALTSAREKANAMVSVLDMKLGDPILISENSGSNSGPMRMRTEMASADSFPDNNSLAPGTISIQRTVHVTFAMASKTEKP